MEKEKNGYLEKYQIFLVPGITWYRLADRKWHVDQLQMCQDDFEKDVDYELAKIEDFELAIEPESIIPSTDEISDSTVIDATPSISPVPEQNVTLPTEDSAASLTSQKKYM